MTSHTDLITGHILQIHFTVLEDVDQPSVDTSGGHQTLLGETDVIRYGGNSLQLILYIFCNVINVKCIYVHGS